MLMAEDEITEENIGEDAAIVRELILSIDQCARYLEITAIPAQLPDTRWYNGRYMSANGSLCRLVVVMDSLSGEVVTTYSSVTTFGGG